MQQDRAPGPDAFTAAIAEEIPRLRRFARILLRGRADAADDLVQETLVRAIAARAQFEPGTNLRGWLFTILRHTRAAAARRAARSPIQATGVVPEAAISGGQEERQIMRDVAQAFRQLAPIHREALWLVVMEGLDYAEAARIMNIPPGTLRSRLSRAREALRQGVGGED